MSDPETPLVFTFLNRYAAPMVFLVALMFGAMEAPLLTGVLAGPLFIWIVVRAVNRRDDPRQKEPLEDDPDDTLEEE